MATQSSPDLEAAAAAAAAQAREEAYLAGLAGQYRLEQYPDSYEAMCEWAGRGKWAGPGQCVPQVRPGPSCRAAEPPVARLLHHGLPRAFALPEDPRGQSDADETAVPLSELLPLPVLMKHSVTAPLAAQ